MQKGKRDRRRARIRRQQKIAAKRNKVRAVRSKELWDKYLVDEAKLREERKKRAEESSVLVTFDLNGMFR